MSLRGGTVIQGEKRGEGGGASRKTHGLDDARAHASHGALDPFVTGRRQHKRATRQHGREEGVALVQDMLDGRQLLVEDVADEPLDMVRLQARCGVDQHCSRNERRRSSLRGASKMSLFLELEADRERESVP